MFGQTFRNIDDVLWREACCTTAMDYPEQTSWLLFLLFLKYLGDLEYERSLDAELLGKSYVFLVKEALCWLNWAAPKTAFKSLYMWGDALEYIDELRFGSQKEKHELSHLCEAKIKNTGNARSRNVHVYGQRSAELLAGVGGCCE